MTRTKLILAGLMAGTLVLGSACSSDKAAERGPAGTTTTQTGNTGAQGTSPDMGTTGDTGGGTGGAGDEGDDEGYEEDDSRFDESQELGGDKFPSDDVVPQ